MDLDQASVLLSLFRGFARAVGPGPAVSVVEGPVYFFQDVVKVTLDVQIHGHKPVSGVEVAPLQSFMLRGGVVDDPVVAGALGVVPKNVFQ